MLQIVGNAGQEGIGESPVGCVVCRLGLMAVEARENKMLQLVTYNVLLRNLKILVGLTQFKALQALGTS